MGHYPGFQIDPFSIAQIVCYTEMIVYILFFLSFALLIMYPVNFLKPHVKFIEGLIKSLGVS